MTKLFRSGNERVLQKAFLSIYLNSLNEKFLLLPNQSKQLGSREFMMTNAVITKKRNRWF